MSSKLSEARQRLADAQQDLQAAADARANLVEQFDKLCAIPARHAELTAKLNAAQAEHAQALVEWAATGAKGDAPTTPAAVEKLAKEIAATARQADSADTAARQLQTQVDAANATVADAEKRLREARRPVLLEAALPLVAEYRETAARAFSLMQHLLGLSATADRLREEVPNLGLVTGPIFDGVRVFTELAPGGAEQSRQAWRDFVRALHDDPTAELGAGPEVIDPDERLRQRAA